VAHRVNSLQSSASVAFGGKTDISRHERPVSTVANDPKRPDTPLS
jgi:hypothetical protein